MIYKMDAKEMKKLLREFFDTRYGKSIFVVCYAVPFITFTVTLGMFLASLVNGESNYILVALPFFCMNIFCLSSYFYYKEVKDFAEHKKNRFLSRNLFFLKDYWKILRMI